MAKAVQAALQDRYKPVQAEKADEIVSVPWTPRDDGGRAVLVSERQTVWDWPLPRPDEEPDLPAGSLGPLPAEWTADLVHCRLMAAAAIWRRLPRVKLPADVRSFLGELQPEDAAPGRRLPLTDDDTRLVDWTMSQLYGFREVDRAVLMGVMSGRSYERIAAVVAGIGARTGKDRPVKRAAIYKRYWKFTKAMADRWNVERVPIDAATRQVWLEASRKI